ncbi:hypothetical protein [uncultured Pontibacter sp.]|uniref:hypothetical protein n=1 Tax=uncultured Pontibacter sp. TaxID=453356 RepID=UPI00263980E4|nr:hypothetical protein [uncultured Pontibacter sp.]
MINLEKLPLQEEAKQQIRLHRDKLLAVTGVKVDILEINPEVIKVRVVQQELKNGYLLNQRQLRRRAVQLLMPLMSGQHKVHYVILTFKPDFGAVTADWLNQKMAEFKLSRNDLIKQTGIEREALSKIMAGAQLPTQQQQAVLYYYIMVYELNRDVREFMEESA